MSINNGNEMSILDEYTNDDGGDSFKDQPEFMMSKKNNRPIFKLPDFSPSVNPNMKRNQL